MALSDWDVFKTDTDVIVSSVFDGVDLILPTGDILAISSLDDGGSVFVGNGTNANGESANLQPKTSFGGALTFGKIRSLVFTFVGSGVREWGFYCMSSQADLTSSGSCYLLYATTAFNNFNFIIAKSTSSGIVAPFSNASPLASSPTSLFSDGTAFALELEWDASSGTQTVLTMRHGTALDFSNLSDVGTVIDTSSPLLTSSGEGLFVSDVSGVSRALFDNTRIEKLI